MRSLFIPVFLLAGATTGWAQQKCLEQIKLPEVGRWAEYKAVYKQKEP